MKRNRIYWTVLSSMILASIRERYGEEYALMVRQKGWQEYNRLVDNAPDLGKGNAMASNAYFAYVFVGAWLASDKRLRPQDMAVIMKDVLYKMRFFFKLTDLNKDPKKWDRTMKKLCRMV